MPIKSLLTFIFSCIFSFTHSQENLPKQALRGIVLNEVLKTPICNGKVSINTTPSLNTITNESGEFSFLNIPVGRYSVEDYQNAYESTIIQEILATSSKETTMEITLKEKTDEHEIGEIIIQGQTRKDRTLNKIRHEIKNFTDMNSTIQRIK